MARSGDGCTKYSNIKPEELVCSDTDKQHDTSSENLIWGWDDADFQDDEKQCATILNKIQ